ncbi:hypothetical protein U1Q18_003946 [Sarracenia purpurea var. burkii]
MGHGSCIDQAGRLRALWRAKRLSRSPPDGDQWTARSSGGEIVAFDGGNMEDDLIVGGLPGQPSGAVFKQYSGYVNVDESKGHSLFYYFAEAVGDPSSLPLVLGFFSQNTSFFELYSRNRDFKT